MFCILDVNNRGGISFIELKTGLQKLGIVVLDNELFVLWNSIRKENARPQKLSQQVL
jgi:hypothetical protein